MKTCSVVLLVGLLLLVAAAPAFAAAPVITRGDYDIKYLFEEASAICGFDIEVHAVGSFQDTAFYDNDGNLTGYKWHEAGIDEIYRPETSEVKLDGTYTVNWFEDFETGVMSAPGTYWSITEPHYGTVLKEAGLWRVPHPDRVVGIHTSLDPAKMELFCTLLSGG